MPTTDPVSKPDAFSPERVGLVRDHLKGMLASNAFAGSKRAGDFLQLIVEHALAGRLDHLRERMIGAEMFGRPIDYDTANDAVVRVKATEVRKKLAQYYQELASPPSIRIELPSGSYVPKFHWESEAVPAQLPTESRPPDSVEQASTEEEETAQTSEKKTARRIWPVLAGILAGVALLAAIGYIVYAIWPKKPEAKPQYRSIAILPLENLSGDARQDYFADGMTEELIADLGQISALRVISRTSVMTYKGTKKTLPEIARELEVDTVVEGSVLREGNQIRITAQLIDAKTDQHLWARSYVRNLNNILTLQGEVAKAIAHEISTEVTPEELARLGRERTVTPEAQDLYLQGMQRLSAGDPKQAMGYLQKAISKDPNYAKAHAMLANSYGWMGDAGWMPYSESFPKQKAEALKAVELDDSLPEGHVELASAAVNLDWNWAMQGKELKRALELNPNSARVRWAYSIHLERTGHFPESLTESTLALQLDPVSSRAFMNSAFRFYYARQYDQALAQMQRASALQHDPPELIFPLALIYAEKGMYEEAIQQFQKLGDAPHALGHMGNAYARMGQTAKAREVITKLQEHVQKTGIGRYEIAIVYAGLGEKDDAFAWLERSFMVRDKGLTYLKIDPCVDPLRSDTRFPDMVRRVGLSP